MKDQRACEHLNAITQVDTGSEYVCSDCIKEHTEWVHLRTCQSCGATLCCDQSPEQHMTKHYNSVHHPVVASAEPGERWLYCYIDDQMVEY